jgi:hypothetical protein
MSTKTKTRKIGACRPGNSSPVLEVLTTFDLAKRVALALDACGGRKALAERAAKLVVLSVLNWREGLRKDAAAVIDRLIAEAKTVRQAETAKRRPAVQAVPRRAQLAVEATPRRAGMKPAKASARALGTKPFSRAASNRVEGTSFRVWGAGKVEAVVSAETACAAIGVMQERNPDLQIGAIHVDRVEKKGGAK